MIEKILYTAVDLIDQLYLLFKWHVHQILGRAVCYVYDDDYYTLAGIKCVMGFKIGEAQRMMIVRDIHDLSFDLRSEDCGADWRVLPGDPRHYWKTWELEVK